MIFFTSDTHFYHKNVIRYSNRPFSSVEEMNEALIEKWNSTVSVKDEVYHLGDVSFSSLGNTLSILDRLNGRKKLILGNHDRTLSKKSDFKSRFEWIKDYYLLKVNDPDAPDGVQQIVLFHYALRTWEKIHYGSWNLFGHSHGTLPDNIYLKAMDVGVDCNNYKPISYERVKDIMRV